MEKAVPASLGSGEEELSFHFSTGQWEEEKSGGGAEDDNWLTSNPRSRRNRPSSKL